jgi:hypothetical protein
MPRVEWEFIRLGPGQFRLWRGKARGEMMLAALVAESRWGSWREAVMALPQVISADDHAYYAALARQKAEREKGRTHD